uniref:vitamin B12 ABC transporter substrate-binding protein BtuF n=1 Tax=Dickeya chrysanthemi TaxID=556 RepID=UPI003F5EBF3C
MKSFYFRLLWLPILLSLPFCRAEPVAQRVVSLAPHATEMAFAAGLGERLVGVSAWSNYPPEAERIEQVANWQGINLERILALKPDLVLAWRESNAQRPLDQLASFGIHILYLDPVTLDDIPRQLDTLAQYSPHPEQAHEAAQRFRQQQHTLMQQYGHNAPVRVFLQFGSQPLFTSSQATLQSQVISLCGGGNIFSDSPVPWPQVSREQVIRRQPQIIVISGQPGAVEQVKAFWRPQLTADVIAVNEDWFSRTGPRLMLAAEKLCRQFAAWRG